MNELMMLLVGVVAGVVAGVAAATYMRRRAVPEAAPPVAIETPSASLEETPAVETLPEPLSAKLHRGRSLCQIVNDMRDGLGLARTWF